MDKAIAGGLIQGAGSIVSGLTGGLFSYLSQKQAYENQVKFWNMQNEYNTPSAQVSRLKDAGLNPALAYGQGGNVANTAGQLSTVPQASYLQNGGPAESVNGLFNIVSNIMAIRKQQAEIDNVNADTKVKTSSIGLNTARENLAIEQAASEKVARSLHEAMKDKTISERQYIDARIEWQRIENQYANLTLEDRVALLKANLRLKKEQYKLTEKQIDDLTSQISFRDITQTGYYNSLTKLNNLDFDVNNPDSLFTDEFGQNAFDRSANLQNFTMDKLLAEIEAINQQKELTRQSRLTKIADSLQTWAVPIIMFLLFKKWSGSGAAAAGASGASKSILYTPSKTIPYSSLP